MHRFVAHNRTTVLLGMALFALLASEGLLLYTRSQAVMQRQLRNNLEIAASLSAGRFIGEELDAIQRVEDMRTPLFARLVSRLNAVRTTVPNIQYAYVLRQTDDPTIVEFVVDADSLDSFEELDAKDNGILDSDEEGSYVGDLYDASAVPALQHDAFEGPASDSRITIDQWGELISGYAPIRRSDGTVAGVIGLDMDAKQFVSLSRSAFSPLLLMLVIGFSIVMAGVFGLFLWQRKVEMLRQIDDERRQMLHLASHQLGAPLATIRWWIEILEEQIGREPGGACDQIHEAVERMSQIMELLRNGVHERNEAEVYKTDETSLNAVIDQIVSKYERKREWKKQQIVLDLVPTPILPFDPKLLSGAIGEFVENAIDYSPEDTTITIQTRVAHSLITVSIHDQGCGVPEQDRDRIFKEFVRGSNAETAKPVGNGFGLAVAKNIIERFGGQVWLESKEGKGSTFHFTLPMH